MNKTPNVLAAFEMLLARNGAGYSLINNQRKDAIVILTLYDQIVDFLPSFERFNLDRVRLAHVFLELVSQD